MKKRNLFITTVTVAVVVALFVVVQPLQSFAATALSVFRVQDVHAINITIADIQQLAQSAKDLKAKMPADAKDAKGAAPDATAPDKAASPLVPLNSPRDFQAFDLKLPAALKSETPDLKMADSQTQTKTLNVQDINKGLAELGAQLLPDSVDGAQITVQTPATAVAKYSNNMLIATQMPAVSGDKGAIDAIKQSFLSAPQIPDDLRAQLATVDLTSGIVYVPVIEGLGQRTQIGASTGYLYALADLKTVLGSLPADLLPADENGKTPLDEINQYSGDGSGLVWTNGGVLYILAGNQPSGELIQIAQSVR